MRTRETDDASSGSAATSPDLRSPTNDSEERPDGRLALRLKTRWRDGTTHILMERNELIERLVPLIPPPRAHQVRYHGILAPGASQRDWIVPDVGVEGPAGDMTRLGRVARTARESREAVGVIGQRHSPYAEVRREKPSTEREVDLSNEEPPSHANSRDRSHRMRWASLLQRVFEINALRCPRCGSTLRLIAAIEDPTVAPKILECLKLPARAPPLEPAAADVPELGHAEDDWRFDQTTDDHQP